MDLGLRDKVALVTGGSRGIGRLTALRLAEEGCHVAICARNAPGVTRTLDELRAFGGRAHGVATDVTAPGEVERFVDESATTLGGLDLLVANVGGSAGGELLDSTPEDWTRTFELNLFHAVRALRAAVPHMRARGGGSAVVISSISGWKPGPRTQYGAAKRRRSSSPGAWPGSWAGTASGSTRSAPARPSSPAGAGSAPASRTRSASPTSSGGSSPGGAWARRRRSRTW